MHTLATILSSAAGFWLLARASAGTLPEGDLPRRDTTCDAVHMFLARGNNEPYPGRQGQMVAAICENMSSCGYEDLIYSALYTDLYCQTVYDGTVAGHVQMAEYASKCPDSKLVLLGYSQGAQIVTDILGGAGGTFANGCVEPDVDALSRDNAPGNMVAAALTFGNPRHTAGQSYNYGNGSAMDGYIPRSGDQLTALDDWTDVLRDWCASTDSVCASDQSVSYVSTHLSYFELDTDEAAAWVKSVASLTADATGLTTSIPTSLSGTAQDYATATDGAAVTTVVLDTTWTEHTSVTATTGTAGTSSGGGSVVSSTSTISSSSSATNTASADSTNKGSITSAASSATPGASTSSSAFSASTSSATSAGSRNVGFAAGVLGVLAPCLVSLLLLQ